VRRQDRPRDLSCFGPWLRATDPACDDMEGRRMREKPASLRSQATRSHLWFRCQATARHDFASSRRISSESCIRHRPRKRAQGMPGDGLAHGPPANKKAGGSHHRFSQIIRHSLRDGFNAYVALSLGTGLSCPHRSHAFVTPASLASASGGEDHTPLPYVPASFVRARMRAFDSDTSTASRAQRS
jgi:hypothetical protein